MKSLAAIFFALKREATPFQRLHRQRTEIIVEITGIGRDRARESLEKLLGKEQSPSLVVVAGYAGALRSGLAVGDVIIAAEVVDAAGNVWPTSWPNARAGRILTVDHLIAESAHKLELGQLHHADAVDIKFLMDGRPVWVALPHPAWVEYQNRTGQMITDSLAK